MWRHSARSGKGVEARPEVREGSVGQPGSSGMVGSSFGKSGKSREALPKSGKGREALLAVLEGSAGLPKSLKIVERPSRKPGMGLEALPEELEGSRGPSGSLGGLLHGPGRVGRSSRTLEKVQEAILEIREGSGGYPGSLTNVGRLFKKSG